MEGGAECGRMRGLIRECTRSGMPEKVIEIKAMARTVWGGGGEIGGGAPQQLGQ